MKSITKKTYSTLSVTIILLLSSSCCSKVANEPYLYDEGDQDITVIQHGILTDSATNIVYQRDGKPLLNVKLQTPVVVAVASKPEGWGYFQFPRIYRSVGDQFVATWYYCADDAVDYGKDMPFMLSTDKGKTWNSSDHPAPPGGLLLPGSGDRISLREPPSIKVSELELPQPIASFNESYGRVITLYRMSEIPTVLQGIYLNRWDRNGVLSEIHAHLEESPQVLRYADNDVFPIALWGDMKLLPDNSVVAGVYPVFYENETGGFDASGISFYRSTDNGMNWKIRGKITYSYDPVIDPNGNKRLKDFGFSEPGFEILKDGTFLCVMRTDNGFGQGPMYLSRSSDQGITWSYPKPFTPSGALPRLLQLENGVLVLSAGRPGVQIRFSLDGKGETWTDPFNMLPYGDTCGYSDLLATGPDSFLVIYSDFRYLNQDNEIRKAIKVREIKVTKNR